MKTEIAYIGFVQHSNVELVLNLIVRLNNKSQCQWVLRLHYIFIIVLILCYADVLTLYSVDGGLDQLELSH